MEPSGPAAFVPLDEASAAVRDAVKAPEAPVRVLKRDAFTESQVMSGLIRRALAEKRTDSSSVPSTATVTGLANAIRTSLRSIFEESTLLSGISKSCGKPIMWLPEPLASEKDYPKRGDNKNHGSVKRNGFSYYSLLPIIKQCKDSGARILAMRDKSMLAKVDPSPKLVAAANNAVNAILSMPESVYFEEQSFKKYARYGTTTGSADNLTDMSTISEYEEEMYSLALALTEWRNPIAILRFLANQHSRIGGTTTHSTAFEIALAVAGIEVLENPESDLDIFYSNIIQDMTTLSKTCFSHAAKWGLDAHLVRKLASTSMDLAHAIAKVAQELILCAERVHSNRLDVAKLVEVNPQTEIMFFTPAAIWSFQWPEFAIDDMQEAMANLMENWLANIEAIRNVQIKLSAKYGLQHTSLFSFLKQGNFRSYVTDICTKSFTREMNWPETQYQRASMSYPADCDKIFPTLFEVIYYELLQESFPLKAAFDKPGEANFYALTYEEQRELLPALRRGVYEPYNEPLRKWLRLFYDTTAV